MRRRNFRRLVVDAIGEARLRERAYRIAVSRSAWGIAYAIAMEAGDGDRWAARRQAMETIIRGSG